LADPGRCAVRGMLRQDGNVLNPLMSVATSASHTQDAYTGLLAAKAFGVGRGFAVLVVVFAAMFALTVLGGHLRASRQRKRTSKQL
jgi:hypothetical protein